MRIYTKKKRISTKYRPHSTLSTKYRPQKFLKKCAFTLFTFKSWDIHILGKWGLSWNMRDKWGPFQLRKFRKALYMNHTALCRPYIQTIRETSIKVCVLNLKMLQLDCQSKCRLEIFFILGNHKSQITTIQCCSHHHLAAVALFTTCSIFWRAKPVLNIPQLLIGTKANNCTYAKGITAVTILGFWWNIDHFDVILTTNLRILTI